MSENKQTEALLKSAANRESASRHRSHVPSTMFDPAGGSPRTVLNITDGVLIPMWREGDNPRAVVLAPGENVVPSDAIRGWEGEPNAVALLAGKIVFPVGDKDKALRQEREARAEYDRIVAAERVEAAQKQGLRLPPGVYR